MKWLTILLLVISLGIFSYPTQSSATPVWRDWFVIEEILDGHNYIDALFLKPSNTVTQPNPACSQSAYYAIPKDTGGSSPTTLTKGFKNRSSLVVSAFLSGREMRVLVDNCYVNYPRVEQVHMRG